MGGGMYGGRTSRGYQQQYVTQEPQYHQARNRHYTPMNAAPNQYQAINASYPTHRSTNMYKLQDNRVFPPQSEFYPGFGGYQPSQRVGYPMDYGPPMSASPPETAMGPYGAANVDPVPMYMQEGAVQQNYQQAATSENGALGIDVSSSHKDRTATATTSEESEP